MKSFRPERVASVVQQVVSEAIAQKLSDPRIAAMTSVTRVEVSHDLEHAKVFVSVMGDEAVQRRTMQGLKSAAGMVQKLLAGELPIRQCPHLSFQLDESIKRAAETYRLIDEAMAEIRRDEASRESVKEGQTLGESAGEDA